MSPRTELNKKKLDDEERLRENVRLICSSCEHDCHGLRKGYYPVKGFILVATMPFEVASPVCEYKGRLMSRKLAKKVVEPYVYDFTYHNQPMSIDASLDDGRFGRCISHSRDFPNVSAKIVDDIGDGLPHLVFFAIKRINVGDETFFEYGDFSKESLEKHPWLGSKKKSK